MALHRAGRRPLLNRKRIGLSAVTAMVASVLAVFAVSPSQATQAPGHDVPAWYPGWAWTYATTFSYNDSASSTNVAINENVTYTVAGIETFQGQRAYKLNITGSVTGGSGSAAIDGVGNANITISGGTVSGSRYVRVSDLALLQENQAQSLSGKASVSIISTSISANINLQLTPGSGWREHDFPLNNGDAWNTATNIVYTGGFTYDAGSIGGTGSSPFDGTMPYSGQSHVSTTSVQVPIGNVATDYIDAHSADGTMIDNLWWSDTYKNDVKEHMVLPLDGAALTLDRNLSSASTPAPATTLSTTITPSLSCAGGTATVSGTLSSHAAGQPVSIVLDKAGTGTLTASATTGANGAYSANLAVPATNDGLGKNGSRANWGVTATSGSAMGAATLVVTHQDCSSLTYTGATTTPTGTSVTASATLADLTGASVAGRSVTFALSDGATVSATTDAAGKASATLPVAGNPRNATLTASYAGAADLEAASASIPFLVAQDATTTSVSASEMSVTIGDPVTFTATVTPAIGSNPTGSVQFYVNGGTFGSPVAVVNGSATSAPYNTTALGDLAVSAQYLGDTIFAPSTSVGITVNVHKVLAPTSTSLTAAPSSAVYGQSVTLSAHVNSTQGSPTGSVTFVEGGNTLGTAALNAAGDASIAVSNLSVGSHGIVAQYSGDADFSATSSSPANITVGKSASTVTLTSSGTQTVAGQAVDLTAQVTAAGNGSGTPTGTVQLSVDGSAVGAPVALSGGSATFPTLTSLLKGSHTVSVSYSGDGNFTGDSDSLTQEVDAAATTTVVTVTPTTSAEDQEVTISANVAAVAPGGGSPTGTVIFSSDGGIIGAGALQADNGGGSTAILTTDSLAPGTHTIEASYGGDPSYGASDGDISHTVIAATARVATSTALTSSKNPATYGELISYTAQVVADDGEAVGGTVRFSVDGITIGDPIAVGANGIAQSDILAAPAPGSHTVIAAYVPDAMHLGSGDTLTQTVKDATVAVHLTSSKANAAFGDNVQFTAVVASQQLGTGKPTGYVQFAIDGLALGDAVALSNGTAQSPEVSNIAPGTHQVTATYSGDAYFTSGLDTVVQTVSKIPTTTVLTVGPAATYGTPLTLSAKVTPGASGYGIPGGTVSFVEGGTVLATAPLSGSSSTATVQVTGLAGGTHSIVAIYGASGPFAGSTSAAKVGTIQPAATSIAAQPWLLKMSGLKLYVGNLSSTLTGPQGPIAGAELVFTNKGKELCSSTTDANGVATCAATGQLLSLLLSPGYEVDFAGTNNYAASNAKGSAIS